MTYNYSEYEGFSDISCDKSVLRDERYVQRTKSLFVETVEPRLREKYPPLYTLRDVEREGLPSAYQIYMASADEYDAATKLVGSLSHWRRLMKAKWFMEGIPALSFEGLEQWREDMRMRDSSMAKRFLIQATEGGDGASARKLYDTSTPTITKAKAGRPKNASSGEGKEESERSNRLEEIARRLDNG